MEEPKDVSIFLVWLEELKESKISLKYQLRCFYCCFTGSQKMAQWAYWPIQKHHRPHSQVFKPSCLGSCILLGLALLITWATRRIALQSSSSSLAWSGWGHWPRSRLVAPDECGIWQWFLVKLSFACLWGLHGIKLGVYKFNLIEWMKFMCTYICMQLRKDSFYHIW